MKMIPFRPSEKYLFLQLAPHLLILVLSFFYSLHNLNLPVLFGQLLLIVYTIIKALHYASVMYFLTPQGIILSKGLLDKHIYWRDLSVFCRLQRERPGLTKHLKVSHLRLGLSGPPAERLTIYGIDDAVLYQVLSQLEQELQCRLDILGRFDFVPKTA